MRHKLAAAVAVITACVVAGVLSTGGTAASSLPTLKTTSVTVSMFEMGFKLNRRVVPRGRVIFKVTNNGRLEHDFSFGHRIGGTELLQPGESTTLKLKFLKRGKFTFICTVEGHQESGMFGVLRVK